MNHSECDNSGLGAVLARLRRRQRWLSAMHRGLDGVLMGILAACVVVLYRWAIDGQGGLWLLAPAGAVVLACGLIGAAVGFALRPDDLRLARAMDQASRGEDRFASALQLASHPRRERAALIAEDAVAHVGRTPVSLALPLRLTRRARWIPAPAVLLAALVLLAPHPSLQAAGPQAPEIDPDQWSQLHDEFRSELAQFPKPQTPEEEELLREFEKLAELLKQNPEKKQALAEIARLSEKVERQRKASGARERSMKAAAKAVASSQSLKKFASQLRSGEYQKAASELRQLSSELKAGKQSPDASEFEAIAADMQRLAAELAGQEDLQSEAEQCSGAASSMNKDQLAEALKRLAEQMEKNAEQMRQCDRAGQCRSLLDELKRRMNQCSQCSGCKDGCSQCQGSKPGNRAGKGGLKAGWGSAANWQGGSLSKTDESRTPELVNPMERQGASTSFKIVSPDEQAQSGLKYEELYAEFVHKAEADLDLESVPVAYRDYLRRYFNSIRPTEEAPASEP